MGIEHFDGASHQHIEHDSATKFLHEVAEHRSGSHIPYAQEGLTKPISAEAEKYLCSDAELKRPDYIQRHGFGPGFCPQTDYLIPGIDKPDLGWERLRSTRSSQGF